MLMLVTTGRRSGRRRQTPLTYVRDESGRLLVSGGAVGQTKTPDWVANLRADPHCEAIVNKTVGAFHGVELVGGERDKAWARFAEALAKIGSRMTTYERRAQRAIPFFRLDPS